MWTVEYERAVRPVVTLGVAGSHTRYPAYRHSFAVKSLELKLRNYPRARPFEGFSIGVTAGLASIGDETTLKCVGAFPFGSCTEGHVKARSGPAIGALMDWNWLLTKNDRLHLATGIGIKNVFVDEGKDSDFKKTYPTGRLSVG